MCAPLKCQLNFQNVCLRATNRRERAIEEKPTSDENVCCALCRSRIIDLREEETRTLCFDGSKINIWTRLVEFMNGLSVILSQILTIHWWKLLYAWCDWWIELVWLQMIDVCELSLEYLKIISTMISYVLNCVIRLRFIAARWVSSIIHTRNSTSWRSISLTVFYANFLNFVWLSLGLFTFWDQCATSFLFLLFSKWIKCTMDEPSELSLREIHAYFVRNNNKVTNTQLVKYFRRFLTGNQMSKCSWNSITLNACRDFCNILSADCLINCDRMAIDKFQ